MTAHTDPELQQWTSDWQADDGGTVDAAEAIHGYVRRRGSFLAAWIITDFAIGGLALPVLAYLGWVATDAAERMAMSTLASITIGAMWFAWWNWRGVLESSARTTADFVAISAERLRRMRQAWLIGWLLLIVEVIVFTVWIWNHLYDSGALHTAAAERLAWGWLAGVTLTAAAALVTGGWWLRRDRARIEAMRRDLED